MLNHWPIYLASKRLKRTSGAEELSCSPLPLNISSLFRTPTNIAQAPKEAWNSNSCFSPSNLRTTYLFYILCSYGMDRGKLALRSSSRIRWITRWNEQGLALFICVRLTAVAERAVQRANDWCSSVLVTDPCLWRAQETNQKRISL